jgi:hypothetical protein
MRLAPDMGEMHPDPNAPEPFTERLMQVQLGRFWRSQAREQPYDPTQAEQRYERFATEYMPALPPAFALRPDTKWDDHLPKLAMQRQLLHIAIFDSVCWNFRPLLSLTPDHVAGLPAYKRVLLRSQKRRMCTAALKELEAVSTLHSLFGGSHTRFAAIIFNTFEAAIVLLCLCTHPDCPFDLGQEEDDEILGLKVGGILTQTKMIEAAAEAFGRLRALAEVSELAASGARIMAQIMAQLVARGTNPSPGQGSLGPRASTPSGDAASLCTATLPVCASSGPLGDETEFWASLEGSDAAVGPMTGSASATLVPEDQGSYFGLQLNNAGFCMPP